MAKGVRSFCFLQMSDVLLDARLSLKDMDLSAAKRHERNLEALDTVVVLLSQARQRNADAVIIPGNLWDAETVTSATVQRLADAFENLGHIPVLITPGLGDPYNVRSFYHPRVLDAYGVRPWSDNVQVFSHPEYREFVHPRRTDVTFYGRANGAGVSFGRLNIDRDRSDELRILIDYQTPSDESEKVELFDFIAFGGCGNYRTLQASDGTAKGAASGAIVVRTLEETGQRAALWVELDRSEEGTISSIVEVLPADPRRLVVAASNINGIKARNVLEQLKRAIETAGARPDLDLVYLRVNGMYPSGSSPDFGEQELKRLYFHVKISDETRPDYFLDKIDQRTTTGRFIQVLQDLKHKAESKGGSIQIADSVAEVPVSTIENALYYGLSALNQKQIVVPDVD